MSSLDRRYNRMNQFLLFLKKIALQNPHLSMSDEATINGIYSLLIHQGVKETDKEIDLSNNNTFASWVAKYREVPNINVFVFERWKYFCQFKNREKEFNNSCDAIKMYVPLDSEHIDKGAQLIFNYLSENNISHISKIGKKIRFDDVVIRLKDPQDAINIFKFIQSNPYLKEGLIEANPFAFNMENIAFASDKKLSYNSTLTNFIGKYISNRIEEGNSDKIDIIDFINFSNEYYQERFVNYDKIEKTIKDFAIKPGTNEEEKLVNIKEIMNLFIASTDPNFSFQQYIDFYNKISDSNRFQSEVNSLREKRQRDFVKEIDEPEIYGRNNILDDKILNMLDTVTMQHNKEYALLVLSTFLKNGEGKYLTRTNDVRNSFLNNKVNDYLNGVLSKNNISINDYCDLLLEERREKDLETAIVDTYMKYQEEYSNGRSNLSGLEIVNRGALLLLNGNYNGFTRSNRVRQNLVDHVTPDQAFSIMKKSINEDERMEILHSNNSLVKLSELYVEKVLEKSNFKYTQKH